MINANNHHDVYSLLRILYTTYRSNWPKKILKAAQAFYINSMSLQDNNMAHVTLCAITTFWFRISWNAEWPMRRNILLQKDNGTICNCCARYKAQSFCEAKSGPTEQPKHDLNKLASQATTCWTSRTFTNVVPILQELHFFFAPNALLKRTRVHTPTTACAVSE